jgi:hypothetical protein
MTRHWLMDQWRDAFVTEMRLRGMPGRQIGEALAEVDAHCADSGQDPGEAFGDPAGYAAARSRAGGPGNRKRISVLPAAFKAGAVVAGVLGLLSGADAVAHHAPGAVTVGQVIPAALAPLLMAAIVIAVQQPGHGSRRALLAVSFPVCATAAAIPQFLWPRPVVQVPGPALLATGLLLLSLALGPATARRLPADRVIDPRTGSEPYRIPAWIPAVIRCALPAVLLAAVLLILLAPARPG